MAHVFFSLGGLPFHHGQPKRGSLSSTGVIERTPVPFVGSHSPKLVVQVVERSLACVEW